MLVVCDTSPPNYLVLMDLVSLLPLLFERVLMPEAVHRELQAERTPESVRRWAAALPAWVEVRSVEVPQDYLPHIHMGERAAIALAQQVKAPALIDDKAARDAAQALGVPVVGTLILLDRFVARGWISRHEARARILRTNFRVAPWLLDEFFPPPPEE